MADRKSTESNDRSTRVASGFPRPEDVAGPTERLRQLHGEEGTGPAEPMYGRAPLDRAATEDVVDLDDMVSVKGRAVEAAAGSVSAFANKVAEQTVEKLRAEMSSRDIPARAKRAGIGVGEIGASGVLGIGAFGALVTAVIAGLSRVMPLWAASLVVAALFGAPAAGLAVAGQRHVRAGVGMADTSS